MNTGFSVKKIKLMHIIIILVTTSYQVCINVTKIWILVKKVFYFYLFLLSSDQPLGRPKFWREGVWVVFRPQTLHKASDPGGTGETLELSQLSKHF